MYVNLLKAIVEHINNHHYYVCHSSGDYIIVYEKGGSCAVNYITISDSDINIRSYVNFNHTIISLYNLIDFNLIVEAFYKSAKSI